MTPRKIGPRNTLRVTNGGQKQGGTQNDGANVSAHGVSCVSGQLARVAPHPQAKGTKKGAPQSALINELFVKWTQQGSHVGIVRPIAALRRGPVDVLTGVFDIASFAMNAVLKVNHKPRIRTRFLNKLINPSGAIPR